MAKPGWARMSDAQYEVSRTDVVCGKTFGFTYKDTMTQKELGKLLPHLCDGMRNGFIESFSVKRV